MRLIYFGTRFTNLRIGIRILGVGVALGWFESVFVLVRFPLFTEFLNHSTNLWMLVWIIYSNFIN